MKRVSTAPVSLQSLQEDEPVNHGPETGFPDPSFQASWVSKSRSLMEDIGKQENWFLDPGELVFNGDVAGEGAGGIVYKVRWRGLDAVAKTLRVAAARDTKRTSMSSQMSGQTPPQQVDEAEMKDLYNEISVLSGLRHPNIVLFLGATFLGPAQLNRPLLLMEYMAGGSLQEKLDQLRGQGTRLSSRLFWQYTQQMMLGLNFLHKCKTQIIHRDLKPANLMFDAHNVLKVTDFGLSRQLPILMEGQHTQSYKMTGETGTYRYMAFEVLQHKPYNASVDVYSFGVILWYMHTGRLPFGNCRCPIDFVHLAQESRPLNCEGLGDPDIASMIQSCVSLDPSHRLRFDELLDNLDHRFAMNARPKQGGGCSPGGCTVC